MTKPQIARRPDLPSAAAREDMRGSANGAYQPHVAPRIDERFNLRSALLLANLEPAQQRTAYLFDRARRLQNPPDHAGAAVQREAFASGEVGDDDIILDHDRAQGGLAFDQHGFSLQESGRQHAPEADGTASEPL